MAKAKKEGKPKRNRENLSKKLKRLKHNSSVINELMKLFKITKK